MLPALIFVIFALLPVIAALAGRQYLLDVGARMMVFAVAAVALDLLVGYAGLISFGHAAFIGLGAYAVGILSAHGIGEGLIALPVRGRGLHAVCLAHRHRCLRTKGAYFIMITLAFGQMVYFIATSLAPYGGDNGLTIAARNTIAGWPLIKSDRAFYYFTLLCLLATYLLPRFGRLALRPRAARHQGERDPHGDHRLFGAALSAGRLCHRRRARRLRRLSAREPDRVRGAGLYVVAGIPAS